MHHYRIAGLNVASDMALPGVTERQSETTDVELRCGPVPARLAAPLASGPVWELDSANFLLRLPGIGRLLARDGRRIAIEPASGVDPQDLLVFALGTGLSVLLYQRGVTVLHASAVSDGIRAYAFCGPSGIGKSTLAAALCAAGCRLVSDDIGAVRCDAAGRPLLWPDARQLKLFDAGLSAAGLSDRRRNRVRQKVEKYFVDPPSEPVATALPLHAIYLLSQDGRLDSPRFERLTAVSAAEMLQHNAHRPRLALALAGVGNPVAITAAILRHVPVFRLTRPTRLEHLPALATSLMSHWQTLAQERRDAVRA